MQTTREPGRRTPTRQSRRSVITAVDTSVLLDVFGADPTFRIHSKDGLPFCSTQVALRCLGICAIASRRVVGCSTQHVRPGQKLFDDGKKLSRVGYALLDAIELRLE